MYQRLNHRLLTVAIFALGAFATGCETLESSGAAGADSTESASDDTWTGGTDVAAGGTSVSLSQVTGSAPLDLCPAGGILIAHGVDTNQSEVLDPDEVNSTSVLRNGSDGESPGATLLAIEDEAAGENCAAGGKQINVGADDNGDGASVTTTDDIDGVDGADGQNGTNGVDGHGWG